MDRIIFIGGGEHCEVAISVLNKLKSISGVKVEIYGIIDLPEKVGKLVEGVEVIGTDNDLLALKKEVEYAFISVGGIGDNSKRIDIYKKLKALDYKLYTIISMDAVVDESASIGEGTIVMPGAIINRNAVIGNNVIINTGAIIEHGCKIGDNVHCAPGVILSGNVEVGAGSHIGTGSTVIQQIKIGENSIIGAGSVVVKNIGNNVVAYGNPCRVSRENEK